MSLALLLVLIHLTSNMAPYIKTPLHIKRCLNNFGCPSALELEPNLFRDYEMEVVHRFATPVNLYTLIGLELTKFNKGRTASLLV
jgi:hypothetical protein